MPDLNYGDRVVFRSRFNRGIAIVSWALSLAVVVSLVLSSDRELLALVALPVCASYLVWLAFWHPAVIISDDEVSLINATYTVRIPWAALIQVNTRYALSLRTPRRSYSATAAPAPGSIGTYSANRDFRLERNSSNRAAPDMRRPGDLPGTDSGAAAAMVLGRWNGLTDEGRVAIGEADTTIETVRIHVVQLGIAAVLIAAAVWAISTLY